MKEGKALQMSRCRRAAYLREKRRCTNQDPLARPDLPELDVGIGVEPLANAYGDVDLLLDEVDAAVGHDHLHAKRRMRCEKTRQRVGENLLQSVRTTDPDEAASLRTHAQSRVFDGIGLVDHRPSVLVDLLAHLGDVEAPSRTLEQTDAEPLLEQSDPPADARLRDAEHPRGRRKAAVSHDRGEELEVVEVTHRFGSGIST